MKLRQQADVRKGHVKKGGSNYMKELSKFQKKLVDLMIDIETERSAYNGTYITTDGYKKIRDDVENKVKKNYPSDESAQQKYNTLKDWYDNVFPELLASRDSKKAKPKSKRTKKKVKGCGCK